MNKIQQKYYERFDQEKEVAESLSIIEGIDIDMNRKTVKFNPNHIYGIDTSTSRKLKVDNVEGIDVISIFNRTDNPFSQVDGNPLIYALKGEGGWRFLNSKKDIIGLLKQFIRLSEKIEETYDTIFTIPSSNVLNTKFLHRLNKIIQAENKVEELFFKLSSDEVWENHIDWKKLNKLFPYRSQMDLQKQMNTYFSRMKKENKGYFTYHQIKDKDFRDCIKNGFGYRKERVIEYSKFFNGKDVLILDDTLRSGKSISEITKMVLDIYIPKSVTVVTLFSRLS